MRAAFINLMSVYPSSGGLPSDVPLYVDLPCRLVPQRHVFSESPPLNFRVAWITYPAVVLPSLDTIVGGTAVTTEYGGALWFELNNMPGVPWVEYAREAVVGKLPGAYLRSSVGPPFWEILGGLSPLWLGPPGWDDTAVSPEWRDLLGATMS